VANLPKTRSEATQTRKDPAPRPVSGLPTRGIEILNKDPGRRYVLVDKGAGGGREIICPESYMEFGWRVETWARFEGLDGELLTRAQDESLRFRGAPMGRPGEPIERMGHVLMSIDNETFDALRAAEQASVDPIEQAIRDPDTALAEARKALKARRLEQSQINASHWNGEQG
jgi:hypothetical protein